MHISRQIPYERTAWTGSRNAALGPTSDARIVRDPLYVNAESRPTRAASGLGQASLTTDQPFGSCHSNLVGIPTTPGVRAPMCHPSVMLTATRTSIAESPRAPRMRSSEPERLGRGCAAAERAARSPMNNAVRPPLTARRLTGAARTAPRSARPARPKPGFLSLPSRGATPLVPRMTPDFRS